MNRHTFGAGLVAAVVIACTGPGIDMMGGAMRDAGEAIAGAGGRLADAGRGMGGRSSGGGGGRSSGGVGGQLLVDAGEIIADAGQMLSDAGGSLAGNTSGAGGSDAEAQPNDALPRPHWVLRDRDGMPVKAELYAGYEPNGTRFTTKAPDCVSLITLGSRSIGLTYKLSSGKIEGCGQITFSSWRQSYHFFADSSCSGTAHTTAGTSFAIVADISYYADGQPLTPKPTDIYQWNATNSTCEKMAGSFTSAFNWWTFKPVPNDVVSLLPKAPYTMELVY